MSKEIRLPCNNERRMPTWIFISYLVCLIGGTLYSITNSPVFGYIGTMVAMYVVSKANRTQIFIFLLGTQFFRAVIRVDLIFTELAFLVFVYVIWFLRFYMCKSKGLTVYELIPIVLLVWDIVASYVWGVAKIGDNILWSISFLVFIKTIKDDDKEISVDEFVLYYCLAIWGICIVNIFAEFALYGQSMAPSLYGSYINGAYFSFGKAYPSIAGGNGIALDTVIGIALCIILLMEKKTSHKVFYLVSIAFFAYCGMLCVARAFYIEIIVLVILIILSQFRRPLRLFGLLFIIGAIAFILINGFSDYFKPLIQAVEIRFNQGNESRVYLINAAQRVLETEPLVLLFGAGTYYPDIFGFTAHNIFYDILVSLGVLGTLIYSIAFIKCIVKVIWRSGKFNLLFSAPLLMFLTYKLISGSTRDVPFYYMMALILIFYRRMNTHRGNSL